MRSVSTDGLTRMMPAIASGKISASRSVSVPPMDSPPTTTARQLEVSSCSDAVTAPSQSANVVRFMSCQRVPCPGSSGNRTV